jgi:hypothetical protein
MEWIQIADNLVRKRFMENDHEVMKKVFVRVFLEILEYITSPFWLMICGVDEKFCNTVLRIILMFHPYRTWLREAISRC